MEKQRRQFLRPISTAAVLPALVSMLNVNVEAQSKEGTASPGSAASGDLPAQFRLLNERMNGRPLVYLDSAATTQRPRAALDALSDFYLHDNANPSKSLHALAQSSAAVYDSARATVARFVNARRPDEIVWTRGTTEAINLVATSWGTVRLDCTRWHLSLPKPPIKISALMRGLS
jgi:cysteine desulfurase / selenocysteine lyase